MKTGVTDEGVNFCVCFFLTKPYRQFFGTIGVFRASENVEGSADEEKFADLELRIGRSLNGSSL